MILRPLRLSQQRVRRPTSATTNLSVSRLQQPFFYFSIDYRINTVDEASFTDVDDDEDDDDFDAVVVVVVTSLSFAQHRCKPNNARELFGGSSSSAIT